VWPLIIIQVQNKLGKSKNENIGFKKNMFQTKITVKLFFKMYLLNNNNKQFKNVLHIINIDNYR